jgi:hypothetical protein
MSKNIIFVPMHVVAKNLNYFDFLLVTLHSSKVVNVTHMGDRPTAIEVC